MAIVPAGTQGKVDAFAYGLTDLILCKLLQGVSDKRTALATRREMLKFERFTTGGVELATSAALNYRTLRARGFTIRRTLDCLIATFCLGNQHSLLHLKIHPNFHLL